MDTPDRRAATFVHGETCSDHQVVLHLVFGVSKTTAIAFAVVDASGARRILRNRKSRLIWCGVMENISMITNELMSGEFA